MCLDPLSIASVAMTGLGAVTQAQAAQQQGAVAQQIAANNAATARTQAADAKATGEDEANKAVLRARQVMGSQRAAYAARGLDVSFGTPADTIDQTDFFGRTDATTARSNAAKQAWGFETGAVNAENQGRAAAANASTSATASILGGAASVADKWVNYTKKPATGTSSAPLVWAGGN